MSKIEVNDRITCINDKHSPNYTGNVPMNLVKGRDYIVYAAKKASCCGEEILDVGIPYSGATGNMQCNVCNRAYFANNISWKSARRFVKKEEATTVVYEVSKVTENVEMHKN